MKNTARLMVVWCAAMSLVGNVGWSAELASHPYQAIAARNVFRLVPPRQEQAQPSEQAGPAPWPKVVVTGVTDVCGRPQALLELGGGGTSAIRRLILQGGESVDEVLVVAIDVAFETVTLAFRGQRSVRSVGQTLSPPLKSGR